MTVCSGSLPLDLTASSSLAVSWAAPEGEVIEMKGPSKIVDSWDGTEYPQQVEFEFQAMIEGCTAPYQEITDSGVEFELDGIGNANNLLQKVYTSVSLLNLCDIECMKPITQTPNLSQGFLSLSPESV